MTHLDRSLQWQRIQKALPWIQAGDRVLDIGCATGRLLQQLAPADTPHVGIDPDLPQPINHTCFHCLPLSWQQTTLDAHSFQAITLLAVWEHIPQAEQAALIAQMKQWLEPGGKIILTIPHPFVDKLLPILKKMGLIKGMHMEEHYGFDIKQTIPCFSSNGCKLVHHQVFQLGLNHLFVFQT